MRFQLGMSFEEPNTYNPNSVAPPELKLLYDSIKEDGYTMPIVCYHDEPDDNERGLRLLSHRQGSMRFRTGYRGTAPRDL